MVEHLFQTGLAIVKIPVQRQRMHIGFRRRRHLAALHLGHAAMREQDEHIHIGQTAERLDGRTAGIAAGGADNGDAVARFRQRGLHHLADELHGKVLEGQRRPVEQLQQEMVRRQLLQRRARRVVEALIGAGNQAPEFVIGEGIADERAHHAKSHILVAKAGQCRDLLWRHHGDAGWQIQSAIAGKPGHHRLAKGQFGRRAAGGKIVHRKLLKQQGAASARSAGPTCPPRRRPAGTR